MRVRTVDRRRGDGAGSVVPDRQLAEILRFHLENPGRRAALITGPEYLAVPSAAIATAPGAQTHDICPTDRTTNGATMTGFRVRSWKA